MTTATTTKTTGAKTMRRARPPTGGSWRKPGRSVATPARATQLSNAANLRGGWTWAPGSWCRGLEPSEPEPVRTGGCLAAIADRELVQDPRNVDACSLAAHVETLTDLAVRVALGDELEDLELARGQPE